MPCSHKFFGHSFHMPGMSGLLPKWKYKTLIIGTFNPENNWKEDNKAEYFYGRPRNYFWRALPCFTVPSPIPNPAIAHHNIATQKEFLKKYEIGLTDLLIRINDADWDNNIHRQWINKVKDKDIERFSNLEWNTNYIIQQIKKQGIAAVYFTKLGNRLGNVPFNTFEYQMRLIEKYCDENDIINYRLHSPSGQGLGTGKRLNKLINRWFTQNGGNKFTFLNAVFDINNFPF